MPKLVSLNIARPDKINLNGSRKLFTGILKKPVPGKIFLDTLGFRGDGVGDPVHHGGEDKAVCVYCVDHFSFWEGELDRKLKPGAFGENLSVTGLPETQVHIGDIFRVGEARVQCTQPRQPCHKLNKLFGNQGMACRVQTTGFSGYYFRVIQPGWVEAGVEIEILEPDPHRFSVADANVLMHQDKKNFDRMRDILAIDALSESWRATFLKRLGAAQTTPSPAPPMEETG